MAGEPVRAAGVVLTRGSGPAWQTLLLHRPHRRDWSLPKGKADPGEHILDTATRECDEETGITPILGVPLGQQRYQAMGRPKTVDYWLGRIGVDRGFTPDDEVDDLRWVGVDEARNLLTYRRDVEYVERAHRIPPTRALIILRHAQAVKRPDYSGPDDTRPLTGKGRTQSRALVSLLSAYGQCTVHTSDSARCVETVRPYMDATRAMAESEPAFTEPGHEDAPAATRARVRQLLQAPNPALVCSHRPVLPTIFTTLAEASRGKTKDKLLSLSAKTLSPGAFVVLHRSFGEAGMQVLAVEVSQPKKGFHEVRTELTSVGG